MHAAISDLTHGLMWTRTGTVWAIWRLAPVPFLFRSASRKSEARALHAALLRATKGEGLLLGLSASISPATVVEAMIKDVDLTDNPGWVAECEATLDTLYEFHLGDRGFWLACPLSNRGSNLVMEPGRAAMTRFKQGLGLPRQGVSAAQIAARTKQASEIAGGFPAAFKATPATVAEQVWIQLHAMQRGLFLDEAIPVQSSSSDGSENIRTGALIPSPIIDPCASSDLGKNRPLTPVDVLSRRFLKITNPDNGISSYQTMMVVADTPRNGVAVPGGEWLGRIDDCGQIVDWALRLTISSREEVLAKNRRANTKIIDQIDQRSDENTGGSHGVMATAADQLAEYQEIIESDQLEVETQFTTIFAVGGPTAQAARAAAREVKKYFADFHFKVVEEASAQESLWWAMLPGAPTPAIAREFAQITTAKNLAAAVPLTSPALGDDKGSLIGFETSSSQVRAVLLDLAAAAVADASPAVAVVGELGSGKSFLLKKIVLDALDRNSQTMVTALDRSQICEWGRALGSVTGAGVVHVASNAKWSLDPLRLFPPDDAARVTLSFLTALLNISVMSEQGTILSSVLEPKYRASHGLVSLGDVSDHLLTFNVPAAQSVGGRLRVWASQDFSKAIFDRSLPVMNMRTQAIVFSTDELELPSSEELTNKHLFDQLPLAKVFGRAMYALMSAIGRRRAYQKADVMGIFAVDEAHAVTASPESLGEIKLFVRDGRKHYASILLGSHDPYADFGDEVLRGLIKCRILLRHTDQVLAERGLRWVMGEKEDAVIDRKLIRMITEDTSPMIGGSVPKERRGEGMLRDFAGRVGRIKVLAPCQTDRAERISSTPMKSAA